MNLKPPRWVPIACDTHWTLFSGNGRHLGTVIKLDDRTWASFKPCCNLWRVHDGPYERGIDSAKSRVNSALHCRDCMWDAGGLALDYSVRKPKEYSWS